VKAFFDTNVIIDVLTHREPFFGDSQAAVSLCVSNGIDGVVSSVTICNLAYILRKYLRGDQLRVVLKSMRKVLGVVSADENAVDRAIDGFTVDFEDSVQLQAAIACGAECVVTRNKKHFADAQIPVYTPTEFLAEKGGI